MNLNEAQLSLSKIDNDKNIAKNKKFIYIKNNIVELYNFIENYYNWPQDTKSSTKLYWIKYGLTSIPKCIACGKELNINQFSNRTGHYKLHCSHFCGCHSPHSRNEYKKTCLEKYGVDHNMKCKKGLDEYKNSIQKKYGVDFVSQVPQIKDKIKRKFIEKYNSSSPFGNKIVIEKIKETCLEKYGVENYSQTEEYKLKSKQTCLEKYGVENYSQTEEYKIKSKQTCLEKYGVEYIFKRKSNIELAIKSSKIRSYEKYILNNSYDIPCFTLDDYLNRNSDVDLFEFECKKCHNHFLSNHHDGFHKHCNICFPKISEFEELEISNFIKTIYSKCIYLNTRKIISPLELDIYIPDLNLAFEFDGLYWHSENHRINKNYHLNKTNLCEDQNIQLIHIFENEWIYKQDIVKSRIKNLLGIYDQTVFARKCKIKEVDSKTSIDFQNENHIQGAVNSKVNLGLYFEDELISLMTFSKPRFSKKYEWELIRFCNKLGYHIPGSASKLLKYFERNYKPKSFISYADRRWSRGNVYEKLGFKLVHLSPPNYQYYNNKSHKLESRIKYQKHKLRNILENFDDKLSEFENMKNNGFLKIYDCGNLVFEKIYC